MSGGNQMPSYPGSSSGSEGPAGAGAIAPVPAPTLVRIAFWLYLVAALLSVVGLILAVATQAHSRAQVESSLAAHGQHISAGTVDAIVGLAVVVAIVFGLIFAAAYVIFALFLRRGANWARIVLTIVTVLSFLSLGSAYGIGAGRVLVSVVATVLLFLGPAGAFFREVKARKAAARY